MKYHLVPALSGQGGCPVSNSGTESWRNKVGSQLKRSDSVVASEGREGFLRKYESQGILGTRSSMERGS